MDYASGLRHLVPYGKIRKHIYIPQLQIELDYCQIQYDQKEYVTNLIALLKRDEDIRHKLDNKGFRSLTNFQWYL